MGNYVKKVTGSHSTHKNISLEKNHYNDNFHYFFS